MTRNRTLDRTPSRGGSRKARPLAGAVLGLAFVVAAGAASAPGVAMAAPQKTKAVEVIVYKSPSCGCCGNWVAYMRRHGFRVTIRSTENMDPVKRMFGVPENLESCHTAIVSGYVVEGHVPASSVRRLLAERPKARGLAVVGMPPGSPGMGGERSTPLDVLIFDAGGGAKRYGTE